MTHAVVLVIMLALLLHALLLAPLAWSHTDANFAPRLVAASTPATATVTDHDTVTLSATCTSALQAVRGDVELAQCIDFERLISAFKVDSGVGVGPLSGATGGAVAAGQGTTATGNVSALVQGQPVTGTSTLQTQSTTTPVNSTLASAPTTSHAPSLALGTQLQAFLQSLCPGTPCSSTSLENATTQLLQGCSYDELSFDGPPTHFSYLDTASQNKSGPVWVKVTHADGKSTLAYIDPGAQKSDGVDSANGRGSNISTATSWDWHGGAATYTAPHARSTGATSYDWHGGIATYSASATPNDVTLNPSSGNVSSTATNADTDTALTFDYLNDANIVYFALLYYDSIRSVGCLVQEGAEGTTDGSGEAHQGSVPAADQNQGGSGTTTNTTKSQATSSTSTIQPSAPIPTTPYCAVTYLNFFSTQDSNPPSHTLTISDLKPLFGASEGGRDISSPGLLTVTGLPSNTTTDTQDLTVGSTVQLSGDTTATVVRLNNGSIALQLSNGTMLGFGPPDTHVIGGAGPTTSTEILSGRRDDELLLKRGEGQGAHTNADPPPTFGTPDTRVIGRAGPVEHKGKPTFGVPSPALGDSRKGIKIVHGHKGKPSGGGTPPPTFGTPGSRIIGRGEQTKHEHHKGKPDGGTPPPTFGTPGSRIIGRVDHVESQEGHTNNEERDATPAQTFGAPATHQIGGREEEIQQRSDVKSAQTFGAPATHTIGGRDEEQHLQVSRGQVKPAEAFDRPQSHFINRRDASEDGHDSLDTRHDHATQSPPGFVPPDTHKIGSTGPTSTPPQGTANTTGDLNFGPPDTHTLGGSDQAPPSKQDFCTPCNKAYYTQLLYTLLNDTASTKGDSSNRVGWGSGGLSFGNKTKECEKDKHKHHGPHNGEDDGHHSHDNSTAWAGKATDNPIGAYIARVAVEICGTGWLDGTIPSEIHISAASSGQVEKPRPIGPIILPLGIINGTLQTLGSEPSTTAPTLGQDNTTTAASMSPTRRESSSINALLKRKAEEKDSNPPTDDGEYCKIHKHNATAPKDPSTNAANQQQTNEPVACHHGSKNHTDDSPSGGDGSTHNQPTKPLGGGGGVNGTAGTGGGTGTGTGGTGTGGTGTSTGTGTSPTSTNGTANTGSSGGVVTPSNGGLPTPTQPNAGASLTAVKITSCLLVAGFAVALIAL